MEEENFTVATAARPWIQTLRILVSGVYRLVISGGALFLIHGGTSPWVILAALPLLILGPRSR